MANVYSSASAADEGDEDDGDDEGDEPAPAAAPAASVEVEIARIWLPDPSQADHRFIVNSPAASD